MSVVPPLTTVVVALAALLPGTGSVSAAVTPALFVIEPALPVTTRISMLAVPPLRIPPRVQLTGAVPEQLPWEGVAEISVTPAGRVSVTTTLVAWFGPLLVTTSVYSSSPPAGAGSGLSALVSARSASATIVKLGPNSDVLLVPSVAVPVILSLAASPFPLTSSTPVSSRSRRPLGIPDRSAPRRTRSRRRPTRRSPPSRPRRPPGSARSPRSRPRSASSPPSVPDVNTGESMSEFGKAAFLVPLFAVTPSPAEVDAVPTFAKSSCRAPGC